MVKLESTSGSITVADAKLKESDGDWYVKSTSGSITLDVLGFQGTFETETTSGSIRVGGTDVVVTETTRRNVNGYRRVGAGHDGEDGAIKAYAMSGSVRLNLH
jgi:DUF4097 and DUF4098 domain-containing protein YvlB